MASIPYFLLRTYKSVENIPTVSAIGLMPWRMNRYRKTINHHTWKSYLKHHQLKDFSVFGEIAEIKSQFLLGTFLCPLPLEFSNFSKNCDFSNFSQFLEKLQKLQKSYCLLGTLLIPPPPLEFSNFSKNCDFSNFWQIFGEIAETTEMAVFAGHPSTSSNTCLNFSKNCDFSNFSQFLEKSQKLQKSQFLLGTLLPLLTLVLINFSKNCDFSNFSQFLEKSQKLQNCSFCWAPFYPL